ncbi:MAG TPA: flagellar motor switch protein FliN [Symbiobacteriaceae bacterium]|jgi:flagellar motor switch protein FliN/FliY
MNEQRISQAEIDALTAGLESGSEPAANTGLGTNDLPLLRDPLGGFISRAVPALTEVTGAPSEGGVADVTLTTLKEVTGLGAARVLVGRAELSGGLKGPMYYVIPLPLGKMLIRQLGESAAELADEALGKLAVALTKMNKAGLKPLSEYLGAEIIAEAVAVRESGSLAEAVENPPETPVMVAGVDMAAGDAMGRILLVLPVEVANPLGPVVRAKAPRGAALAASSAPMVPVVPTGAGPTSAASPAQPPASPAPPAQPPAAAASVLPTADSVVQPVKFPSIAPEAPAQQPRNMELLMDVRLKVTVEIGRTRRHIRDVLSLGPGYVLELDRLANEQVDVLVNGKLVAKAEVVVVDENYGARITEVISPGDRVQAMRP